MISHHKQKVFIGVVILPIVIVNCVNQSHATGHFVLGWPSYPTLPYTLRVVYVLSVITVRDAEQLDSGILETANQHVQSV